MTFKGDTQGAAELCLVKVEGLKKIAFLILGDTLDYPKNAFLQN